MSYYPHHQAPGVSYPHVQRAMNYPQGYHPHTRPYGRYAPHNSKNNEKSDKDASVTSASSEKSEAEERIVSEQDLDPALVFKTPPKTNSLPQPPMKAPTKPSSEKESVVDAAAKAEAEKSKAKAKENDQPKDAQVTETPNDRTVADKETKNQPTKPTHMPPVPYHHPYGYPGYMPHMMHPYPPPYAMMNVTNPSKTKPFIVSAQSHTKLQASAKDSKVTNANKVKHIAVAEKAVTRSANVKSPSVGPKIPNPGSTKKNNGSKWCKSEVSCR